MPAAHKPGSPPHRAVSRSRKQPYSQIKPLVKRDNASPSTNPSKTTDANNLQHGDINLTNVQALSCNSYSHVASDKHRLKSMMEFEDRINAQFLRSNSPKAGDCNALEHQEGDLALSDSEMGGILELRASSYSRQNFAWKLVRYFFSDLEIKDHNCYGRKGKPSLEATKLNKVRSLAFQYYPAANQLEEARCWRECVVAIDKGIRNTFCDYNYGSRGRKSDTWDFHLPYLE